jgi:two-component system chemotaxis sensor kinase CheA
MFSGNTILGDGSVIMIIDPNGIAQSVGSAGTQAADEAEAAQQNGHVEKTVSLLVFRAGSQQPKAVPLSLVTRLEEIDCKKIELSNGRHLAVSRPTDTALRISEDARAHRRCAAAVNFSDAGRSMASW